MALRAWWLTRFRDSKRRVPTMRAVNKAALITGASRGIGRGIALALAKLGGFDLAINYASNEAAAQETAAACEAA